MSINDYRMTFEDRGSYLYVFLTGTRSFASCLSYWNEIVDRAAQIECSGILVHETMNGSVSEEEMEDLIMDIREAVDGIRVALYDENPDNAAINQFGCRCAAGRGIQVRVFQSLEEAEAWIEKG